MDATYFAQFCLIAYQDDFDGYTQLIRFTDGEHYEEIREDLNNLLRLGVKLESITTDGHKSVLKAINKSDGDIITQRCLVHIQRMCLIWLTKFPKHIAGQELRKHVKIYPEFHQLFFSTLPKKKMAEKFQPFLSYFFTSTSSSPQLLHKLQECRPVRYRYILSGSIRTRNLWLLLLRHL